MPQRNQARMLQPNFSPPDWNINVIDQLREQYPEVGENARLAYVLLQIDRWDAWATFLEHGISDLWFPFPKQTLRHFLGDPASEKHFFQVQQELCHEHWTQDGISTRPHGIFEDADEVIQSDRILGEGGFAIVEQVTLPTRAAPTICVRKKIGRPKQLKAQKQILEAFARELKIMRQVDHRHCVQLVGSYTDHDALAIFSLPVADMDLAAYLNIEILDAMQLRVIRRGMGCLCVALCYLHDNKIRHEDLKPQNVLIRGENILLTDFGFSLDFSEDSVSTTTGRPSHWTARYSAPESLDHQARNRATDIWGLGCILTEMLSRLLGYRLSDVTAFWKESGNRHPSYALNADARSEWLEKLADSPDALYQDARVTILLFVVRTIFQADRLLRPTAQQLVRKYLDIEWSFPANPPMINLCCWHKVLSCDVTIHEKLPAYQQYFYPSVFDNYTYILADLGRWALAHKNNYFSGLESKKPLSDYFISPADIDSACMDLLLSSCLRLGLPKSQIHATPDLHSYPDAIIQAGLSMIISPLPGLAYSRHCFTIAPPSWAPQWGPQRRDVQISLVPICFERSELYGRYFFVISFRVNERFEDEHKTHREQWV